MTSRFDDYIIRCMKALSATTIDVKARHFYVPLSDPEMRLLDLMKKNTGKSKSHFVRDAILEKLEREENLKQLRVIRNEE